ncbi:MAG: hypothetical protein M1514_02305 [Patescibacteria group bacterium]|nr:hypothetical protein [Patescibacteria group bacterium]
MKVGGMESADVGIEEATCKFDDIFEGLKLAGYRRFASALHQYSVYFNEHHENRQVCAFPLNFEGKNGKFKGLAMVFVGESNFKEFLYFIGPTPQLEAFFMYKKICLGREVKTIKMDGYFNEMTPGSNCSVILKGARELRLTIS